MKLILKFMKPYKKLFVLTLILLFVDVIGALYIPTLVADMMNKGATGNSLNALYTTGFQMALISFIQMVLPVPAIFVVALFLTIQLDPMMGSILLVVLAVVILIAAMIMRMASPLFRKLQKLLDRMSTILLENLTGVRVVVPLINKAANKNDLIMPFKITRNTDQLADALL